jgi:hypothetical protein
MLKNKPIRVIHNFEGAMIGNYSIKDNNVYLNLKKEKPTYGYKNRKFDYNLHFHFCVENTTNKKVTLNFFIGCKSEEKLHYSLPRLWISDEIEREYVLEKNIFGKTDSRGKYFFKIKIDAEKKIFIANFPPIRFSRLNKILQDLSLKTDAKEVIIGKTICNNYIKAYEYGNQNKKPTILFVSGYHPPERDTIAIEAIMERFTNKKWKNEILNNYSFSLIPIINPDGFANAMQGSNIKEINFHWKFFGNDINNCPEANLIWKYCLKIKPIVFFDFHAFTYQNNTARPYLIPKGYYIGKISKNIQNDLNKDLKKLCNDNYSTGEKILAPNILSTGLRNKLGTITIPKFHLHMKDGLNASRDISIQCLDIILKTLNRYKINSDFDILKKPYGKQKTHINDIIRIYLLNFFYFKIKPLTKYIPFK